MNENACIYLRKSRADREAEARGEGETLARHERILLDLAKSRNVIVVSLIISLALGITFSAAGAITFHIGEFTLNFSGLAVAAIVGIVVNAILPGKDYDFQNNYEYGKTTEDHGQML